MKNKKKLKTNPKKKKTKKFSWKVFIIFIVFEIIFTGVSGTLLVFYGPFKNVRKQVVNAAMTTLTHQYIAKAFLSDAQIDKIRSEDIIEVVQQDVSDKEVKVQVKRDPNIERFEISDKRYKGYMLVIHDPLRVKVGYSKKLGTEGQLTSQMAKDNDAVAAINGGGFTDKSADGLWTGTGGQPVGILMSNGEVKHNDLKNSDERVDVMALTKGGLLLVGPHSINEMKNLGVTEAISFGPAIVVNGKGTIKGDDGGWGIAPRTSIGQREDGAILMLVIDGRQVKSIGATLRDVQNIMLQYKAVNATNLDGGSSATMYFDGDVINNPCDPLGERAVPSCVYVKP